MEWGTFTSVADSDGSSIPWIVLGGADDLPCFVIRSPHNVKAGAFARVRMETPVLYFYTPRRAAVSVEVKFTRGRMTEWYPPASEPASGSLAWKDVEAAPGEATEFPSTRGASRYFAARETDSVPLRAANRPEKFLFYRGVGDFQVPLRPRFTADGAVRIGTALPAILFENRGGKIGYRLIHGSRVEAPELTGDAAGLRAALAGLLTNAGLYPKEARAMVETWHDSWFEEGMRVLYIVPRETVDAELPLTIAPPPQELARVFVGRVELLSPPMRETIGKAMAVGDIPALQRYGRFLNAFAAQMPRSAKSLQLLQDLEQKSIRQSATPHCVE